MLELATGGVFAREDGGGGGTFELDECGGGGNRRARISCDMGG